MNNTPIKNEALIDLINISHALCCDHESTKMVIERLEKHGYKIVKKEVESDLPKL